MKLGLGLYRRSLNAENFDFARQAGATHIVAHLVNYFDNDHLSISSGGEDGWGVFHNTPLWTEQEMRDLIVALREKDLSLAAIENIDPTYWHDILLDGPLKNKQIEKMKELIRRAGRAGVPCLGYNFTLAGVWGWHRGPYARGGATSVRFDWDDAVHNQPIPDGMVANMRFRARRSDGVVGSVSHEEIWQRLAWFLDRVLPVAEESQVALALHPDDPPVDALRGTARLVNLPEKYRTLLSLSSSPANKVELCVGTVQEMPCSTMNAYELVDELARQDRIGYLHLRNVKGKVPRYHEAFIDEGDLDIAKVIAILHRNNFDGVVVPDHTPDLTCAAPWHAGMAFALGYIRALIQQAERGQLILSEATATRTGTHF